MGKTEKVVELSVMSYWEENLKAKFRNVISILEQNFKELTGLVFQNAEVKACLLNPVNEYVFQPEDQAPGNIIIICKNKEY